MNAVQAFARFTAAAPLPATARRAARVAVEDTLGVTLAGAGEAVSRIVQGEASRESPDGPSPIVGTPIRTSPAWAAAANGTAAHALDYDDMCWATLAHPSAPLVAAAFAFPDASGRAVLDSYVVGFEIGAVLGRAMNPDHYAQGWHATATIGTVGAAAVASRLMGLAPAACASALATAASAAAGLKANFGTMVKPLQVGLAARNGVQAALLARAGLTASVDAIDGPQGLLVAMQGASRDLEPGLADLGRRWEIVEGGITVKLYPSCAATHPTIDALLDLRREAAIDPAAVEAVDVTVDAMTPTVLVYDRPRTGLEAKFSLHYCAAAALAHGRVDMESFVAPALDDPVVARLLPRVKMRIDETLTRDCAPLTQARVQLRLVDGRAFDRSADGARGYPDRPATPDERAAKFRACARRAVSAAAADEALTRVRALDTLASMAVLTAPLTGEGLRAAAGHGRLTAV